MRTEESVATSKLKSLGCCIESSGGHTTRVSFEECIDPTYDDLRHLAALPHLQRLCFYGTPVDSEILSSLTCSLSLTNLNLNCTSVTEDAVKLVANFPNLRMIGLMATSTADDCLDSLLSCADITNLRIDDTRITPVGTTLLAQNLELETFWIGGSQLSAESLLAISKLSNLREFNVCGESVVDSHIEHLLTFDRPECLFVRNTRIVISD